MNHRGGQTSKFMPGPSALVLVSIFALPEMLFWLDSLPFFSWFDHQYANLRIWAIANFSLWPGEIAVGLQDGNNRLQWSSFFSYPFVHATPLEAIFSIVFVLVIRKLLSHFIDESHTFGVFFGGSLVGGIAYYYFAGSDYPLIGAAPGYMGLMGVGTATMMIATWSDRSGPMGALARTVIFLPIVLIGLEVAASAIFGKPSVWLADLGGFALGILAAPLVLRLPYSEVIARLLGR